MPLILITPPAVEPITAAEIKPAARIDGTEFDGQIAMVIPAIRAQAEHLLGRRLITQTVELVLDDFPSEVDIDLMLPDVQSIVSVKYYDASGVQQTIDGSAYYLDSESTPCWLIPVSDWPTTGDYANAVRIRYVVGYGNSATDVPADVRLWIIASCQSALDNQPLPAWIDRLLDAETVHRIA